jgi:hypothetical protein
MITRIRVVVVEEQGPQQRAFGEDMVIVSIASCKPLLVRGFVTFF